MANTYSSSLRLILQTTNSNQGTWGDFTNTNIGTLLEQAITGIASITASGSSDYTLSVGNGVSDESRNATISVTGTISTAINVICPAVPKIYIVRNGTTGGYAITFKTASGTGISIPNGSTMLLYCDGTNVKEGVTYISSGAFGAITGTSLTITSGATSVAALSASGTVSGAGFSNYLASPPAIGGTAQNTINGTTITATTQFSGPGTGLTGTAAGLSIGGNAATATSATSATSATTATSATSATTATNLASGSAGTVPYQSASGTTAMLAAGTTGQIFRSAGATAPSWGSAITRETSQSASGTSVDFNVPSWVNQITVMFRGVSTTGTNEIIVQLGTSGGVVSTGYLSAASTQAGTVTASTAGFILTSSGAASDIANGQMIISAFGGNEFTASSIVRVSASALRHGAGGLSLGGTLTRLRITTTTGVDTFDAGTINITYS